MTPNNTYTARYDLQAGMAATQSGTATRRRTSWRAVALFRPDDDGSAYGRIWWRTSYRTDGADHGGRVCSMAHNQDGQRVQIWTR